MVAEQTLKSSVFMVTAGNVKGQPGDVVSFVQSQAGSIRTAGWKVTFGLVDDRTSLGGILRNVRRLKKEIRQKNPGLVHAQYGSVIAAVTRIIRGQIPLVVSFCGDDLLGTPHPNFVWSVRAKCARAIGLWAAKSASVIIVKSNNLFQALPISIRNRAIVLPNGVDINWFRPMDKHACRNQLGWDSQAKIVVFNASRNEDQYRKNPALAGATIKLLSEKVSDVVLYPISNVPHETVPIMLNAADCLLVTSFHEGSPNIVKEAMACNLPVVSVPCGDVEERLKTTHPGRVRPYNAVALAEAILEVFDFHGRSNGREQVMAQGLTLQSVAKHVTQIYSLVQREKFPVVKDWGMKICAE